MSRKQPSEIPAGVKRPKPTPPPPPPSKNSSRIRIECDEIFEPSENQCMSLVMACMASVVLLGCLLWR